MSEILKKFLVDLASDPARMSRFEANPAGELDGAGLSAEDKAVLLSRDSARLRRALGVTADHLTFRIGIIRKRRRAGAKIEITIEMRKKEKARKRRKRAAAKKRKK